MNISYDESCGGLCCGEDDTLRSILQKIKSILGHDFPFDVKWIIFNPDTKFRSSMSSFEKALYPRKGKEYGFYDPRKKEIWVSAPAVRLYNNRQPQKTNAISLQQIKPKQSNLLIYVIIDEITHAITGRDHGSKKYKRKYQELIFRCKELL